MKFRDFERLIKDRGYHYIRSSGSHGIYTNGSKSLSVPRGRDVNKMLARRLLKEIGAK